MNTSTRTLRAGLVTVLMTILTVLSSVVAAQPASAAVWQQVGGSTGAVTVNGPLITGRDAMYYNGYAGSYYTRSFATAGVTVSRSGAYAGTQRVYGAYVLQRYVNGAWQNVQNTNHWSGTVSGTGRLTFPAFTFGNAPQYSGRWAYRIAVALVWENANTGAVIGSGKVVSSNYSDNACATRFIACTAYTDSVVM